MPLFDQADKKHPWLPTTAFRAWSGWTALIDGGCYQVRHIAARRERMSLSDAVKCLCEIYARAVFETAFGMFFSDVDSRADVEVLAQITDAFGPEIARRVAADVAEVGPVPPASRKLDTVMP